MVTWLLDKHAISWHAVILNIYTYLYVENNRIKQLTNMAVKKDNESHRKCIYQY